MGSYYKHTRNEWVDIPYSFRCENCTKDSGSLKARITATAEENSIGKTLPDKQAQKLQERAHANLVREVKRIYKDASEKNIVATEFKDKCPHCGQPQSWGVSGMKKKMYDTPVVILILGLIIGGIGLIGHYFADMDYMTLPICFGIIGAGAVIALLSLIWNLIRINVKVKKTSASMYNNLPQIEWNTVQNFINDP